MAEIHKQFDGKNFTKTKDTCENMCQKSDSIIKFMETQMRFEGLTLFSRTIECTRNKTQSCTLLLTKKK